MAELKNKILEEMTTDYSDALEKNFEMAKKFLRITKEGKVDIPLKNQLTGEQMLLLYLIGKLYAHTAELCTSEAANNEELKSELGVPEGSLHPWLKSLRDSGKISQVRDANEVAHAIKKNQVERALKEIEERLARKRV